MALVADITKTHGGVGQGGKMPHTALGRLCCRMGIGSAAAFGVFFGLVAAGQRGGDQFFSNPWLATTILAGAGLAIAAAVTGLWAITKHAERAWTVVVVTAVGLLVTLFAAGELLFPH